MATITPTWSASSQIEGTADGYTTLSGITIDDQNKKNMSTPQAEKDRALLQEIRAAINTLTAAHNKLGMALADLMMIATQAEKDGS